VNNIISTRRALTDLDNSQLQLNRHIAFIYVVIVFYLLSKARVLAGTSVSAPLQSGWFDVCWISLLSPCLVGLRGVKKNKGKPSRGDFPGVCSSRKHASKSIQFDGTCVQSPSSLVGGGTAKWFLGALPPVHCHGTLSLSIYAWLSVILCPKDVTRLDSLVATQYLIC